MMSFIFQFILWVGTGLILSLAIHLLRVSIAYLRKLLAEVFPASRSIIDRFIYAWFMGWFLLARPMYLIIYPLFLIIYPTIGLYQAIFGQFTGILIINEAISRSLSFGFWALIAIWLIPQGIIALKINLGAAIRRIFS
jgi:hypothetical protein